MTEHKPLDGDWWLVTVPKADDRGPWEVGLVTDMADEDPELTLEYEPSPTTLYCMFLPRVPDCIWVSRAELEVYLGDCDNVTFNTAYDRAMDDG